jgi:hypothetical protein
MKGTLQKNKTKMLATIDAAIENPSRLKPEFLRGL